MSHPKRFGSCVILLAVVTTCLSAPAGASSTITGSMAVSSTVQSTCLVSATPLAFGTYTGLQTDATAALSVTCTNTTPYNVGLNAGLATGATVSARAMNGPSGATLNYAIYSDSARTTNWGNTIATDTVTGTGNGSSQSLTVYGREAASQYVTPGSYLDTITVTVTY